MDSARLKAICQDYATLRVAVFGDFCLDRYLEIDPAREETSLETGLPAHQITRVRSQPGGAGTVAGNVAALGVRRLVAVGFCGHDGEGFELTNALDSIGAETEHFLQTTDRCTFTYCKPLVIQPPKPPRELNRLDTKNWTPTPPAVEQALIDHLHALMGSVDLVLILEQMERVGCGAVTPRIKQELATLADANPNTVFLADSRANIGTFRNVTIKVNDKELASHFDLDPQHVENPTRWIARWASEIGRCVFVTFGPEGIMAATPDGQVARVSGIELTGPLDVVGAGDAVSANVGCALAAGATAPEAAMIGNLAGSIVVQKIGTTGTASADELIDAFSKHIG